MEKQIDALEAKSFGNTALEATVPAAHPGAAPASHENSQSDEASANAAQFAAVAAHIVRSANWFYWIAGLSLVNVVTGMFGGNWKFAIGLGMSEALSAIANEIKTSGGSTNVMAVLYAASLCITAFFAACGWFARRPSSVAFIIGMAAFALDTIIFVLVSDWIGVAFHGLALYYLWRGLSITLQIKKLQS